MQGYERLSWFMRPRILWFSLGLILIGLGVLAEGAFCGSSILSTLALIFVPLGLIVWYTVALRKEETIYWK